ncbi:P-loop ATPase, Sll1717 family [Aeromonas schubertii]|uniref:P-loop ATPase, Sll1717 family n=1 Tax=Aeromonas schubertii TaxID=652 RepID=UPI000A5A0BA2|nr:hypothetical protein [Aeromonas schubertii]
MNIDLISPDLFGNDAGEDEIPEVLNSYFLEKREHAAFFNENHRLSFVRSRKGVGKSTLLREAMFRRERMSQGEILLYVKASDLVAFQNVDSSTPGALIHGWQQRICSRINFELGSTLKVALSDDKMSLIEQAELSGFRGRNLVGSLLDRMRIKVKDVEIHRERITSKNPESLLQRVMENNVRVWIFIDDVDATFLNSEDERLRASTFFSACRNLCNSVSGLNIRASVRTDVWTILSQYDEALDKCEQYMLDLKWSTKDSAEILENKIKSYFDRTYSPAKTAELVKQLPRISNLVFKEPWPWGKARYEAVRPIHILSAGRPRWASQLCRLAGKEAYNTRKELIYFGDVSKVLTKYGQARLGDLYKEHRHQCVKMENIIESFSGGERRYTTSELIQHIETHILDKYGELVIDGLTNIDGSLGVAHFIYRIGFITARDQSVNGPLEFVSFEDRPNLLSSFENLDDGLDWEIHPAYRAILRIK